MNDPALFDTEIDLRRGPSSERGQASRGVVRVVLAVLAGWIPFGTRRRERCECR